MTPQVQEWLPLSTTCTSKASDAAYSNAAAVKRQNERANIDDDAVEAELKERYCEGFALPPLSLCVPVPPGETMPSPFGPMAFVLSVKAHD